MNKQLLRFPLFLLMYLTLSLTATAQVVDIPDPNLRAAIENKLGKVPGDPISIDEMTTLTGFAARNSNISDLTGLEGATNLKWLGLDGEIVGGTWINSNSISDLSPLAGLTNLTELWIGGNSILDISPLAGLTNLISLTLEANSVLDISAMEGLTNLTSLHLAGNNVSDLSPLVANAGLGSGDTINVRGNPLSNLSIHTYIPTLQGRGVTVEFDNQTPTILPPTGADLNVGEPHTVRLIYFLPNDRAPQQDINTKLDTLIRDVQQFYADEMERHGFEGKTFTFETDVTGKTVVHRVDGQFTDSYYHQGTFGKVAKEIAEKFDTPQHIYMAAIDVSNELIDLNACGEANRFWERGGREFIIPASGDCFNVLTAAHELGHAFELDHDFRNGAYIMSYGTPGSRGRNRDRISQCAAEWLDSHRFFNSNQAAFNEFARINKRTVIQMLPPLAYSSKAIRLRFEVTDTDGLHQAQLIIPTTTRDPVEGSGIKLHGCKSLRGENSSLEFITTELTVEPATEVILQVIDIYGGITRSRFTFTKDDILPDPTNRIPTTLEKISGDNQHGLSITPLPNPLVVKVTDQNGIAFEEIVVTFTVIAGDGTLSVTRTTTDENGRAESTLTLGPNLGENTVEVFAEGLTVTFNAVAGAPVDIPDLNLRVAIETELKVASGTPISPADMATLTRLEAPEGGIRNLTGLEHATHLTELFLNGNAISDLSPLAGLTNLTLLKLDRNSISDISAVANLIGRSALKCGVVKSAVRLAKSFIQQPGIHQRNPQ